MIKKKYYRPDIDGLRALAVIPVVLFHLEVSGFSGGYIGVDIFFVISGFLITSIIVREIEKKQFSLINFWYRRVKRILPALITVLITTTIASYFITLYPLDFKLYGLSLFAQSTFLINIYFMRKSDYFAAPTDTVPLLHTWSLAVEEQFYIFLPLLLLSLANFLKKRYLLTLTIITLISLMLSIYFINFMPDKSFTISFLPHIWGGATYSSVGFYSLPTRAWELLFGSLIAIAPLSIKKTRQAESLTLIGLSLILISIFTFSDQSPFPGLYALVPVLGTTLIIKGNQNIKTFTYKLLSFPVFVWIGLISYSLYLWHWPIIVLSKQIWFFELPRWYYPIIITTTFVLSIISYRYIEIPFRSKYQFSKIKTFGLAFISLSLLGLIGLIIYKSNGVPNRIPESAKAIAAASADTNPRRDECFKNNLKLIDILGGGDPCFMGSKDKDGVDYLLWGDSHANAIMPVFDSLSSEKNKKGAFIATGGCAPVIYSGSITKNDICIQLKNKAVSYIKERNIKTVFLVADWPDTFIKQSNRELVPLKEALSHTVSLLPVDTQVIIIQTVPRQDKFIPRDFIYASREETLPLPSYKIEEHRKLSITERNDLMEVISKNKNTVLLDPTDFICSELNSCQLKVGENIIYSDESHINNKGALLLKPMLDSYF